MNLTGYHSDCQTVHEISNGLCTYVILKGLVGTESWVLIDDVIVHSKSAEEHALRPENVLRRFDEANKR